jgi:hypothetical protein
MEANDVERAIELLKYSFEIAKKKLYSAAGNANPPKS